MKEGKYLAFTLAAEEFGISILKVKEIIGMMSFSPIPRTPDFVKGVISLRGKVIPVVDLRLKFGMKSIPHDERTCIFVVEMRGTSDKIAMGVVVDAVNEVVHIKEDQVEATPSFGMSLETTYILGMAKNGENARILLNIDRVLVAEEMALLGLAA